MDKLDIDNVQSINYQRRDFEASKHTCVSDTSDSVNSQATSESFSSVSTGSEISTTQIEKTDSIKSCESILKIFSFESRGFTKWNVKCTDFWNLINKHPEIKPVNCVIMDAFNNKRDAEVQTVQQESEASFWGRALYELQKRNLHNVALAGSQKKCNYCADTADAYEAGPDEDLIHLNKWHVCKKGSGESSASTISSETFKPQSEEFNVDLIQDELTKWDTTNQLMLEEFESSDIIGQITEEDITYEYEDTVTDMTDQQMELLNIKDTEQLLEPTYMIETETSESLEETLNVTPLMEEWEYLQNLGSPESNASLAEELNRDLIRRLSEAITNMEEEGNYWSTISPITPKLSKEKVRKLKQPLVLEEESEEKDGQPEIVKNLPSPIQETEPFPRERKSLDYKLSLKENYNYAQKVLSLLGIDFEEYKNANARTKTKILQENLKENYSRFVQKEPQDPVFCPCTEELKILTKSECSCKGGICKPQEEFDEEEMEVIAKKLPHGPGVECFRIMIEEVAELKKKNLATEEMSAEIKKIILKIQNREVKHGPCRCILHTTDIESMEQEAKDVQDIIYTSLDKKLDEKYQTAIGIKQTESKEVQIEQCEDAVRTVKEALVCADICEFCGALICDCGKKKFKKHSKKSLKSATGSCAMACDCDAT